jgi:hypothetical protein
MKRSSAHFAAILLLLFPLPAHAAFRYAFFLSEATWFATDIVVVVPTPGAAETYTVLETWKGTLAPGLGIHVPNLPRGPIPVAPAIGDQPGATLAVSRIVLFLKPAPGATPAAPSPPGEYIGTSVADNEQLSAVWLDRKGNAYAFSQGAFQQDVLLRPLDEFTEESLHRHIQPDITAYAALHHTLALSDSRARLPQLAAIADAPSYYASRESLAALGKAGPAAIPLLLALRNRPNVSQRELALALAAAAGPDMLATLAPILHDELPFWTATAPALPPDWRNLLQPAERRQQLSERLTFLTTLLHAAEPAAKNGPLADGLRSDLQQLHNLWRANVGLGSFSPSASTPADPLLTAIGPPAP